MLSVWCYCVEFHQSVSILTLLTFSMFLTVLFFGFISVYFNGKTNLFLLYFLQLSFCLFRYLIPMYYLFNFKYISYLWIF